MSTSEISSADGRSRFAGGGVSLQGILKNGTDPHRLPHYGPQYAGPMTRSRTKALGVGESSSLQINQLVAQRPQNLKLRRGRGRRRGANPMSACESMETISISSEESEFSAPNCPRLPDRSARPSAELEDAFDPSEGASEQPQHELGFNNQRRINVLETLVNAFPLTVPENKVCTFLDSCERPDLTSDLKRHFLEKRCQHRNDFERKVSVFRAESPWEPKWFTGPLMKLILTTKSRPTIYQYIFEARQREDVSATLEKWKALNGFARWTIGVGLFMTFLMLIGFLIDTYGEEGITISVPLIIFINIVANKILINLSGTLPSDT